MVAQRKPPPKPARSRDPRLVKLAIQTTRASQRHTIGGRLKDTIKVKPVTLPRLKCLEEDE
jgi:hypothetical protein